MSNFRRLVQVTGLAAGLVLVALLVSFGPARAQSGEGALQINARACAEDAKAQVVVQTASVDPQEVAKGQSGSPISIPAGRYDVEITCTDLIDHPNQTLRGVEITAGETVEREVTFLCGTTILHVKRGGKTLTKQDLSFRRANSDEELPGTAKVGEPFKSSPGQYEAQILLGRGRKKAAHIITGIQVYDGAKRHIPVDL